MGNNKLPKKIDISKVDGVVKQSVLSLFSVKNPRKYLDTVTKFPSRTSTPTSLDPVSSRGATPLPPNLLYVATGYVEEGYV